MAIQTLGLYRPEPQSVRETRANINDPGIPINRSFIWGLFDGDHNSAADEIVSPQTAMGQSSVNACVGYISESIASMNPILYELTEKGRVEATKHPLYRILTLEPSQESTAYHMWAAFMKSILLWGNGYIEIQRDGVGNILGLYYLHPSAVSAERLSNGMVVFNVSQGMAEGAFRQLPAKSIIHVPWHSTHDGITGRSVIAEARNIIGTAIGMDKYAGRFFANNAIPSGILSTAASVKPEDKAKMRQDWTELQSGKNLHKTAILDNGLDYKVIGSQNTESQWIEAENFYRQQICGLFKMLPSQIGDTARVAGETYASQQMAYLTHTLRPWMNAIAQELNRKLLAGLPQYVIEHDASDMVRLDVKTQMDASALGRQWGILTANETRALQGRDPIGAEGDITWAPVNMMNAARLLDAPTPTMVQGTENV
jgi:HK97 family phage portal protein